MSYFERFIKQLETQGGQLLILCSFVILTGVAMNRLHYSDQIDTVMISVFSGFSGALLTTLTRGATKKTEDTNEVDSK
jgi:hypothetical protein